MSPRAAGESDLFARLVSVGLALFPAGPVVARIVLRCQHGCIRRGHQRPKNQTRELCFRVLGDPRI